MALVTQSLPQRCIGFKTFGRHTGARRTAAAAFPRRLVAVATAGEAKRGADTFLPTHALSSPACVAL